VIDARIRRRHGDLTPHPALAWSAQIPETDDPERGRFLTQLAAAMDDRRRRIGEHAAAASRPWALAALGAVPDDPAARLHWERKAAAIGAYRELSGHDHPEDPIGPEPATGSPDLRAAWKEARSALTPHDEVADVRHLTDGQLLNLRSAWPQGTREPDLTADKLRQTRTAARDANLGILRAYAEANSARRRGEHDEAARQETLAGSYQALRDAYRARETELNPAIQVQQAREREKQRLIGLAKAADAELRRRHPHQPWPLLPTADPQGVLGRAQERHLDHERGTAIDSGLSMGDGREGKSPALPIGLAELSRQVEEMAARRRGLAARLPERYDPALAAEEPVHDSGATVPFANASHAAAILEPPKPEMPPSSWVLERVGDQDLDLEAAD